MTIGADGFSPASSEAVNEVKPLSYNEAHVCILASFIRYGSASPNAAYNNKSWQLARNTLDETDELKYDGAA
jgi:hypothetical protein